MSNILIGVTGGIAAYKSLELARNLTKKGHTVDILMTAAASKFVGPLSFSSLIKGNVYVEGSATESNFPHLELSRKADLFVMCPATANSLSKYSKGFADNILLTTLLSFGGRVIVCPSMNERMWRSEKVQTAIRELISMGVVVVGPEKGELACGVTGEGRLSNPDKIVQEIEYELVDNNFEGINFLITSGPTREWIDEIRFISNSSSGKMGYFLALEALRRKANVTYISGPTQLVRPYGANTTEVETAKEMEKACKRFIKKTDILIMAAAVSDFSPVRRYKNKIKKEHTDNLEIKLKKNPDILKNLSKNKKEKQIFVGFSLDSENLYTNAKRKLKEKSLDLIVANKPFESIGKDTTSLGIIDESGLILELKDVMKRRAALEIIKKAKQKYLSKTRDLEE